MLVKPTLLSLAASLLQWAAIAEPQLTIESGALRMSRVTSPSICRLETSANLENGWDWVQSFFSSGEPLSNPINFGGQQQFFRLRVDPAPATAEGFANLIANYGILDTIAGTGLGQTDGVSFWDSSVEGQSGKFASLSRPHYAQADLAGNVYIFDKNSHSVLKVAPDGSIHTFAGTHEAGFNGDGPAPATSLRLNEPNGGWVKSDGIVYVQDTENGKIRKIKDGVMTTLFNTANDGSPTPGGRGLWVNDDETLAYFCAGTRLRRWTPSDGVKNVATGFDELGTLYVEANGDILVCDRVANYAYRVSPNGSKTIIAGNGSTGGGGDGFPGTETGLAGVRSIWPMPIGGYLLLTHDGCQLWHMNAAGVLRLFVNGDRGRTHAGDGQYFYSPEPKISEGRSVTMDYEGNILVTESDWGYVRKIFFQPMPAN